MRFDTFLNNDKGVSFGLVFLPGSITVCFLKWEWQVSW